MYGAINNGEEPLKIEKGMCNQMDICGTSGSENTTTVASTVVVPETESCLMAEELYRLYCVPQNTQEHTIRCTGGKPSVPG